MIDGAIERTWRIETGQCTGENALKITTGAFAFGVILCALAKRYGRAEARWLRAPKKILVVATPATMPGDVMGVYEEWSS